MKRNEHPFRIAPPAYSDFQEFGSEICVPVASGQVKTLLTFQISGQTCYLQASTQAMNSGVEQWSISRKLINICYK